MAGAVADSPISTRESAVENSRSLFDLDWGALVAVVFAITLVVTFVLTGVGVMDITPQMAPIATGMFGFIGGRFVTVQTD